MVHGMAAKHAYLTIDDAPSIDFKQKIEFLRSKSIPAVIFCEGKLLEQESKVAITAIHDGLILGNHSYNYPCFSSIPLDDCFREIIRTDQILDAIYKQSGMQRLHKFFRFPYGDKGFLTLDDKPNNNLPGALNRREKIQTLLKTLGYTKPDFPDIKYTYFRQNFPDADVDWGWTYDAMEWSLGDEAPEFGITTIEQVFARMDEDVPEGGRGLNDLDSEEIILIHDHPRTTSYFQSIINQFLIKGIIFRSAIREKEI